MPPKSTRTTKTAVEAPVVETKTKSVAAKTTKAVEAEVVPESKKKTTKKEEKVVEPVVEAKKATKATATTPTTTKKSTEKAVAAAVAAAEPTVVESKAPQLKKVKAHKHTEEEIQSMYDSQEDYFSSLNDEKVAAEFKKIRSGLGVAGFDKALAQIKNQGGVVGTVHNKKKSSDKKSEEYEKYVRMRAAPHKNGGVVYIGHLPKGFTEDSAKKFFQQFGEVKRIQLSRAKKTGTYRGWGFIEFADRQVAAIVAESMDKYMMFGRTLQCHYIPYDQLHPETFRNNFRDFKKINFTQIHNDKVNQIKGDEKIEKMRSKQLAGLNKKKAQLEKMGLSLSDIGIQMGDEDITLSKITSNDDIINTSKRQKLTQSLSAAQQQVQLPVTKPKGTKAAVKAAIKQVEESEEEEKPVVAKRSRVAAKIDVEEEKPKKAVVAKKVATKKK